MLGPTVGERRGVNSEQRVQAEISKTGLDEILYSRLEVLGAERAVRTR